jgi:hypothetical protein
LALSCFPLSSRHLASANRRSATDRNCDGDSLVLRKMFAELPIALLYHAAG